MKNYAVWQLKKIKMNDFPSITDHLVVWVFGIIFPFLSGLQSEKLNGEIVFNAESRKKLYLGNSLMLAISGGSIIGIWFLKKRPFESLGFRTIEHFTTMLILPLIIFIIAYTIDLLNTKKQLSNGLTKNDVEWFEKSSFLPEQKGELKYYIILCICAGIFEEIIYRSFMVTYFLPLQQSGFPFLALFAPAILFSLAHYYQGWQAVFKIMLFSSLLGWIFIVSKSIYLNMFIHFMVDLISGILIMKSKKD
jgi:membrane protease YdiL (CAAX protease family)